VTVLRICRYCHGRNPQGIRCPCRPDPKAWANSGQRKTLRRIVFARQGGRCCAEVLGLQCSGAAEELHHIVARVNGGSDDPSNLCGLCAHHHLAVSKAAQDGKLSLQ
jgi:5-methylcytosine-specific restriction endonuclease McrA